MRKFIKDMPPHITKRWVEVQARSQRSHKQPAQTDTGIGPKARKMSRTRHQLQELIDDDDLDDDGDKHDERKQVRRSGGLRGKIEKHSSNYTGQHISTYMWNAEK